MKLKIKRIYEPAVKMDGSRILADRLWPRGISKQQAQITAWLKELTPSNELRVWLHADKENRWKEFEKKYIAELKQNKNDIKLKLSEFKGPITLVTSVKDIEHSHIPVLVKFLESL